jgi:polyferredoxin
MKNDGQPPAINERPAWRSWLLPLFCVIGAGTLFLLPFDELNFWTFDYLLFLSFLLAVPTLLLPGRSRRYRAVIIIFCLAYFGFLQAACPRLPGAIELIALHLFDDHPIVMHLIKVGVVVGLALLFGRYYCGWICPKGVIQEYVFRPGAKVKVPPRLDRALKYVKYAMLVLLIALPLLWEYRLFQKIGPFRVIFNLDGSTAVVAFLAVVLFVSLFVERAYCRYFCPEGALLALAQLVSPYKMRLSNDHCRDCRRCLKVCPVDALVTSRRGPDRISTTECIACKECQAACPRGGLHYGLAINRTATASLTGDASSSPKNKESRE